MRPRRLRASAFGPFATTVEIDFRELGHRNLLLIEGPTGAGKTSLLDAMTYALFGAVPGARHEIEGELKSGFAEPHAVCEVELEFALGERTYIARRRPAQERAKKRGVGRVSKPPEASLVEILEDGSQVPVCLSKAGEVDAAVERLLGLKVEQFQKVLLLPQGEFRELLLARSADKEQLLERLFGTALYADAVRRLGEERRTLERRAEELRRGVADLLEQHGATTVEALGNVATTSVGDLEKAREAARRLGEAASHARQRHEQAARLAERLRERDDARKEARAASDALAGAESTRRRLAEAERAERVRPALERAELERGRAARLAAEAAAAGLALLAATEAARQASHTSAELAPTREAAQRARDRRAVLAELAPVAAQAGTAAREAEAVGKRIKNGQAHVADVDQKRVRTGVELDGLVEPLARAAAAGAELPARVDAANAAQARLAGRRELSEAESRVRAAQHSVGKLDGELPALRARLEETRAQVRLRREAREANLAAELAAALVPGEACPVCGGHEHPAPARAGRQAMTVQQVSEAERQAQELADRLAERERERARLNGQAEEHENRARALRESFGADSLEAVQAAAEAALASREQAERAAAERPRLEERRAQLAALLELQARQLRDAHGALTELDKSHAALAARAVDLHERLAASLPPGTNLGEALAAAAAEIARLDAAIARADAAQAAADKALAAARERHSRAEVAGKEAGLDAAEHAATAESAARAAGFADAAEALRQLVPPAALEAERRALLGLANRNIDASARAAAAEKALAGVDMAALADAADLPARRREAEAAERDSREASSRKGQLEERVEQLRQASERAARREGEYERVAAALTMLGQLARVVGGENPLRMSLPRYVLAARMEEVAVAASERFFAMSRGRYRLRRTDEVRHAGRGSGLDLVVDDAMTGHERAVHSLSGGEMFMASLSLAMGLADVVQSHAGGIRLDSLFIDEGFGTLDDETLDQVMRTLEDLRAGGRLVGLISHVAELKERIPTRLTVSKATRGSTARLVVG